MMHQREHEHEEILRRALRSAADRVEPSADGLERIRARITAPRPAFLAWLIVGYAEVVKPLFGYLEPCMEWLHATTELLRAALGPVIERFKPARPDAAHPHRRYAWLRPAAAMTTAVFVVAMGAFALTALPQVISQSGAFILPIIHDGSGGHGGRAKSLGHGSRIRGGGTAPPGTSAGSRTGGQGQPTPGCTPSKGASTGPAASPSTKPSSPAPSPSLSTSPSSSPSPSPTPSPTPTDSTTPSPTDSATPNPNPAGGSQSPAALAAAAAPIAAATPTAAAAPDPAPDPAAITAAVPAGAVPTSSHTATPCKVPGSPHKKHVSTQSGTGLPAISHAKARQGA
jgi:hypothetical protein